MVDHPVTKWVLVLGTLGAIGFAVAQWAENEVQRRLQSELLALEKGWLKKDKEWNDEIIGRLKTVQRKLGIPVEDEGDWPW